ncbi:hypothetical protein HGA91_02910 [candidate division WWE3 bacterium]|nr:hypothetical protein [candidate division WWE3 bacterium]
MSSQPVATMDDLIGPTLSIYPQPVLESAKPVIWVWQMITRGGNKGVPGDSLKDEIKLLFPDLHEDEGENSAFAIFAELRNLTVVRAERAMEGVGAWQYYAIVPYDENHPALRGHLNKLLVRYFVETMIRSGTQRSDQLRIGIEKRLAEIHITVERKWLDSVFGGALRYLKNRGVIARSAESTAKVSAWEMRRTEEAPEDELGTDDGPGTSSPTPIDTLTALLLSKPSHSGATINECRAKVISVHRDQFTTADEVTAWLLQVLQTDTNIVLYPPTIDSYFEGCQLVYHATRLPQSIEGFNQTLNRAISAISDLIEIRAVCTLAEVTQFIESPSGRMLIPGILYNEVRDRMRPKFMRAYILLILDRIVASGLAWIDNDGPETKYVTQLRSSTAASEPAEAPRPPVLDDALVNSDHQSAFTWPVAQPSSPSVSAAKTDTIASQISEILLSGVEQVSAVIPGLPSPVVIPVNPKTQRVMIIVIATE